MIQIAITIPIIIASLFLLKEIFPKIELRKENLEIIPLIVPLEFFNPLSC